MDRSKKIIIFAGIIFILIIIACILIFQENKNDRLLNIYKKISTNKIYTFSMEEVDSEINYKITVSQKNEDINIDTQSKEQHTSTLVLKGHVYVILHDMQEYYTVDSSDIEADIIISGLKEMSSKEYKNGKEEILGKMYYFEEYEGISNFLLLLRDTEESHISTKFYFDNNKLVYIKNIIIQDEVKDEELLKINLDYKAEESLFQIPDEYAEM